MFGRNRENIYNDSFDSTKPSNNKYSQFLIGTEFA